MVKLQLAFLPHTTGYVHVQTNPKLCFSTGATLKNATSKSKHNCSAPELTLFKDLSQYLNTW